MRRASVCMVTLEFPPDPGGVGQSVYRIARMLTKAGMDVHVVVFHTQRVDMKPDAMLPRGFEHSEFDGIKIYRSRAVVKTDVNPIPEFLSDVAMDIENLHAMIKFDVFHAFFVSETGFLTTLVGRELNVPVIVSVRGSDLHKNVFNKSTFAQTLWALENASWVTFVSRDLERRAVVLAPTLNQRTIAFWNSVDVRDLPQVTPSPRPASLSGFVVGAFGRFRDKKGIDFLIRACEALSKEIDLTLLLVGDFAEKERSFWQRFIDETTISNRIVVTGVLPWTEALGFYQHIDVVALPSLRDGCPNTLLEAMALGKSIVGSTVDAIGEILIDDDTGLTVRPGNAGDLTDAIRCLANDDVLRARLGANAQQFARTHLTPEVELENWLTVYRNLQPSTAGHSRKEK